MQSLKLVSTNQKESLLISSLQIAYLCGVNHHSVMRLLKSCKNATVDNIVKSEGRNPSTTLYLKPINALKLISAMRGHVDIKSKLIDAVELNTIQQTIIDLISSLDTHDLPPDRYVYVARESESGRYKIGISKDPVNRVKNLNTGNPEVLQLIHYYKATESGYQSETIAHAIFAEYRIRGEWFEKDIDLKLIGASEIMGALPEQVGLF